MTLLKVIVLAIVQGLAELLPVSSSAHVVVAEKLLGLDPSSPPMTLLLVTLHTGTMLAVVVYFWRQWRAIYFHSAAAFRRFAAEAARVEAAGFAGEAIARQLPYSLDFSPANDDARGALMLTADVDSPRLAAPCLEFSATLADSSEDLAPRVELPIDLIVALDAAA